MLLLNWFVFQTILFALSSAQGSFEIDGNLNVQSTIDWIKNSSAASRGVLDGWLRCNPANLNDDTLSRCNRSLCYYNTSFTNPFRTSSFLVCDKVSSAADNTFVPSTKPTDLSSTWQGTRSKANSKGDISAAYFYKYLLNGNLRFALGLERLSGVTGSVDYHIEIFENSTLNPFGLDVPVRLNNSIVLQFSIGGSTTGGINMRILRPYCTLTGCVLNFDYSGSNGLIFQTSTSTFNLNIENANISASLAVNQATIQPGPWLGSSSTGAPILQTGTLSSVTLFEADIDISRLARRAGIPLCASFVHVRSVVSSTGQNPTMSDFIDPPISFSLCVVSRVLKFFDLNGDGIQQSGEPGIPGWQFNVTGPSVQTLTTQTSGLVSIQLPEGVYNITELFNAGVAINYSGVSWVITNGPATRVLNTSVDSQLISFGNICQESIVFSLNRYTDPLGVDFTNLVFVEYSVNGGTPTVSGPLTPSATNWSITIPALAIPGQTIRYRFQLTNSLSPVYLTGLINQTLTTSTILSSRRCVTTLSSATVVTTTVPLLKYIDVAADGSQNATDPVVSWNFTVVRTSAPASSPSLTLTTAAGTGLTLALIPGTYTFVEETVPLFQLITPPTNSVVRTISSPGATVSPVVFGNACQQTLGVDVTVPPTLLGLDTLTVTFVTPAGTETVSLVSGTPWRATSTVRAVAGSVVSYQLFANGEAVSAPISATTSGNYPTCTFRISTTLPGITLFAQKYIDINANFARDVSEPAGSGWTFGISRTATLAIPLGTPATTTTSGTVSFLVAPGDYSVSETQRSGFVFVSGPTSVSLLSSVPLTRVVSYATGNATVVFGNTCQGSFVFTLVSGNTALTFSPLTVVYSVTGKAPASSVSLTLSLTTPGVYKSAPITAYAGDVITYSFLLAGNPLSVNQTTSTLTYTFPSTYNTATSSCTNTTTTPITTINTVDLFPFSVSKFIDKDFNGNNAAPDVPGSGWAFTFASNVGGLVYTVSPTSAADGSVISSVHLPPGTYSVTETLPSGGPTWTSTKTGGTYTSAQSTIAFTQTHASPSTSLSIGNICYERISFTVTGIPSSYTSTLAIRITAITPGSFSDTYSVQSAPSLPLSLAVNKTTGVSRYTRILPGSLVQYDLVADGSTVLSSDNLTISTTSSSSPSAGCIQALSLVFPQVKILGKKLRDCNNDGDTTDPRDTPLQGAQFLLTGAGLSLTATSDASGNFEFLVPKSDTYTISETAPPQGYAPAPNQTLTVGTTDTTVTFVNVPKVVVNLGVRSEVGTPNFRVTYSVTCTGPDGVVFVPVNQTVLSGLLPGTVCTVTVPNDNTQCASP